MNNFVSFLYSQSVLLPLLIGLIRIRKIERSFHPFLVLIMLAALTELLSFISIKMFQTNAIVSNVYCLLECLLILYQFYRWHFHARHRKWYWVIPAALSLVWIIENLVFMKITDFGPVFRISYAFLIVVLSINEINYLITHENRQLFRNARFLICIGFIIYFLYQILFEGSLNAAAEESNPVISNRIISLAVYINVLVNLIFAAAMLCIPAKKFDFNRTMEKLKKHPGSSR
ncbi:MAG TPA: hypothetical protein VGD17_05525 [Chitinophagaceae bacterium]